jgi:hypothetical protein
MMEDYSAMDEHESNSNSNEDKESTLEGVKMINYSEELTGEQLYSSHLVNNNE